MLCVLGFGRGNLTFSATVVPLVLQLQCLEMLLLEILSYDQRFNTFILFVKFLVEVNRQILPVWKLLSLIVETASPPDFCPGLSEMSKGLLKERDAKILTEE